MTNPRFKPLLIGVVTVALAWVLALTGYRVAANSRMTAEKVIAALHEADLARLDSAGRARRLRELAAKFNALSPEDRRRARRDPSWGPLWREMGEEEKGDFIDRTMPVGFKQMINAFEQLPEDKRRSAITNTLARLQKVREGEGPAPAGDSDHQPLSEDLQKKVVTAGLKTFYSESSAQTKAELAPVLEEMQRLMESGQLFRR